MAAVRHSRPRPNRRPTPRPFVATQDVAPELELRDENWRRSLQSDTIRGSLWTLIASAINLPLTLVAAAIAVRELGSYEYAHFALFTAIYAVAVPLANGGVTEATMQWVAESNATHRTAVLIDVLRRCAGYHLLVQGPLTIAVIVVLLRDAPVAVTVVTVLANVIYVLVEASTVVLMGTGRNATVAKFAMVMTLASSAGLAIASSTSHVATTAWAVQVIAMVVSPLLCLRSLTPRLRAAVLRPLFPRGFPDGFAGYAVAAMVNGVVALLVFSRSEIFALSAYHQFMAVAIFTLATTVAGKLTVLTDSLTGPLAAVAAAVVASAPELASRALGRSLRVSSVLAGITAAAMLPAAVVLSEPIFGSGYHHLRLSVAVLGVISCLTSSVQPLSAFAFATRSVRGVLVINLLTVALDFGLVFSLAPAYGLGAAVAANVAAQLLNITLQVGLVARKLHMRPWSVALDARGILVMVPCLPVSMVVALSIGQPAAATAAGVAAGLVMVMLVLRLVPAVRLAREDLDAIAAAVPAKVRGAFTGVALQVRLAR